MQRTTRWTPARALSALVFGACVVAVRSAAGHGGVPRAVAISVQGPEHWVAESDAWGLIVSEGDRPRWICAEVFEGDSLGLIHPTVSRLAGGAIAVANQGAGLWRSDAAGCEWSRPEAVADAFSTDLVLASDRSRIWMLGSNPQAPDTGNVWHSVDDLQSLTSWGTPLPSGFLPTSLAVREAATPRLYVASVATGSRDVSIFVSSDEGQTWAERAAEGVTLEVGRPTLAAHPTAEGVLFLHIDRLPASQNDPDPPDTLYVSSDDGATFSLVLEASADLPGLAFSPSGAAVAAAGPAEGLIVADVSALRDTGAAAWTQVNTAPIWGLAWTDDGLYAGMDDFASSGDRAWLGISTDGGGSFDRVLGICDVEPLDCPSTSSYAAACTDVFERLTGFDAAILQSPRCRGSVDAGAPDAGTPSPVGEPSSGCSCGIVGGGGFPDGWAAALGAMTLLSWRRRHHGSVHR